MVAMVVQQDWTMPADQVLTTSWSDGAPGPLAFCVPEGRMTAAEMNAWNLSHEGTSYVLSSGSNTHFMTGESWCVLLEQLLKAWHAFLHSLKQPHITTFERDRLVLAILPIFHHPFIKVPMRILSREEVQQLAGLRDHFNQVHIHKTLLTEMTVRNYCGNSFHPDYAAVGHPERLRSWFSAPVDQPSPPAWQGVIISRVGDSATYDINGSE